MMQQLEIVRDNLEEDSGIAIHHIESWYDLYYNE